MSQRNTIIAKRKIVIVYVIFEYSSIVWKKHRNQSFLRFYTQNTTFDTPMKHRVDLVYKLLSSKNREAHFISHMSFI